jgi:glycolate oxidase iron-sulfur subunit
MNISSKQTSGFFGLDIPSEEDLYKCVHCGLCLNVCPTYLQTGKETESPRGRIAFMKAVTEGRLPITQRVSSHWDSCLACRACEAACPSGVPYGQLIEDTRAQLLSQGKITWRQRVLTIVFLHWLLPNLALLRVQARLIFLYQKSGLRWMLRMSRLLKILPGNLYSLDAQMPTLSSRFFGPSDILHKAAGRSKLKVGLLSGCVMPLIQSNTMEAAIRVLQRNGCDVVIPQNQGCCGALNVHSGDLEMARRMAKRNIDVFLDAGVEKIVTVSAGCGSVMKEYNNLIKNDIDYVEKSRRFGAIVVDITELLCDLPFRPPESRLNMRVTYQDPCHLVHAQRNAESPRRLLRSIHGLEFVEMENSDICCGAAGLFTLTQRKMSLSLLADKMQSILDTGCNTVATANPGCMIQLEGGFIQEGSAGSVVHVIDLLDRAYRLDDLS